MNDEIIDIYESANERDVAEFKENVNSSLHIKIDSQKVIKDTEWVNVIEQTLPYIDNIFRNPNRFIVNEEEIVKIERARRITVESIKDLSKNTNYIQEIDKKTGDVKPSKILNINKEESYNTYENRLIYTLIQNLKIFISQKKKILEDMEKLKNKNDKQLTFAGISTIGEEKLNINITLATKVNDETNADDDIKKLLKRVEEMEVKLLDLTSCETYRLIDKAHISLVREPIKKTNLILKNVNFQYAMQLWNYIRDNFEDKTRTVDENIDYYDESNLRNLMNQSFLLDYLILNSMDKDKENIVKNKENKKQVLNQILEKLLSLDDNLTEDDLKKLIGEKFAVVKYKKQTSIQEIQKIFSKNIEKYLEKIGENI